MALKQKEKYELLRSEPASPTLLAWEETHPLVPAEIAALGESLAVFGIDATLVGMELEFFLPPHPLEGFEQWQEAKAAALAELEREIARADGNQRQRLQDKKCQLAAFNAREMLMYQLIEKNADTKGLLEPLFGTGHDGDGYYDGADVLELKMSPVEATKIAKHRAIVLSALYRQAKAFGLRLIKPPYAHVSFSFWKDGKNLLDPAHPDFSTLTKALVEGVTRAVHDAAPLVFEIGDFDRMRTFSTDTHVHRLSSIRMATGRFEVRLPSVLDAQQDPDMLVAAVMAGAAYGLDPESNTPSLRPAVVVRNPSFRHAPGRCKVIAHALGNAVVCADGSLSLPEHYLRRRLCAVACEMGIIGQEENLDEFASAMGLKPPPWRQGVIDFFRAIRIVPAPDGLSVLWPETAPGVYAFRAGGQSYAVDVQRLKESVWLIDVSEKYIVSPGYTIKKTEDAPSLKASCLVNLLNSPVFGKHLSARLRDAFTPAAKKKLDALRSGRAACSVARFSR